MTTIRNESQYSWMNKIYVQQQVIITAIVSVPAENKLSLIEPLISPLPNHFPSAIIQQKGVDSQFPPPRSTPNGSRPVYDH